MFLFIFSACLKYMDAHLNPHTCTPVVSRFYEASSALLHWADCPQKTVRLKSQRSTALCINNHEPLARMFSAHARQLTDKHKSETVPVRTFKPLSTIWFWAYPRGANPTRLGRTGGWTRKGEMYEHAWMDVCGWRVKITAGMKCETYSK